jgi:hypothetical protein
MIAFPDYPDSQLIMEATVVAKDESQWDTLMTINGTYKGPTDVVAKKNYRLIWTVDGNRILEWGSATLESSSGQSVRCECSSTISSKTHFEGFPAAGEVVDISISPFEIDNNSMSYQWEGTVQKRKK